MKKKFIRAAALCLALLTLFPAAVQAEDAPVAERTLAAKEDAYVLNSSGGEDMSNKNFGFETEMQAKSNNGALTRYSYIKFDISDLAGASDFTCVDLDLFLTFRQDDSGTTPEKCTFDIYGCSNDWSEGSITFAAQPERLGFIGSNSQLTNKRQYFSVSITDYVRQALNNGETEISLYIEDATKEAPTHMKFSTKEGSSDRAPKLSVYYGTKIDDMKYEPNASKPVETPETPAEPENKLPELSSSGLDAIFGHKTSQSLVIEVSEDASVEGGESGDNNYGSADILDLKYMAGDTPNKLTRFILLKFDITGIDDDMVNSATLTLNCTLMEDKTIPTTIHAYGCNPQIWSEMGVTFNNSPEKEDLLSTAVVYTTGEINLDVTDYLNTCLKYGDTEAAFIIDGDPDSVRRLYFASKETGKPSLLAVSYGDSAYTTDLDFTGENPWQVAMENYSSWHHRWEKIKKGGDTGVEVIEKIAEEYPIITEATYGSETDGYNTRYRQFETRLISTLKGYSESTAEVARYDEFGGLMDESLKQDATGYFYTKKIGDRWWTIDPLGYPFYRVACVTISQGSPIQKANLLKKYGSNEGWAEATTDRLYELGFNSAGGWSDIASLIKTDRPLSQTSILYVVRNYASSLGLNVGKSGHTEFVGSILPVFDPAFVDSAIATVQKATASYIGSPYVYGWFGDNELPADINMLDNALKLDPHDSRFAYSYANAWTFMYMKTGKSDVTLNDITDELRKEYRAMSYDKYFSVVTDALQRCVPMHQFIGCRFVDNCFKDEYIMRVAGYYCDVITLNYYSVWQGNAELLANLQRWSGKPFAVTEWYAKGMDVWEQDNRITNKSGAGWTVKTQAERGVFYQNYALQLLECKGCVGFDWFQYLDNDPDNLEADLSNRDSNKGIYNTQFEEYTGLTDYMKQLNEQKYNLISFFDER